MDGSHNGAGGDRLQRAAAAALAAHQQQQQQQQANASWAAAMSPALGAQQGFGMLMSPPGGMNAAAAAYQQAQQQQQQQQHQQQQQQQQQQHQQQAQALQQHQQQQALQQLLMHQQARAAGWPYLQAMGQMNAAAARGFDPAALNNTAAAHKMAAAAAAALVGARAATPTQAGGAGKGAEEAAGSFRGVMNLLVQYASRNFNGGATESVMQLAGVLLQAHEAQDAEVTQLRARVRESEGATEQAKELEPLRRKCALLEGEVVGLRKQADQARLFLMQCARDHFAGLLTPAQLAAAGQGQMALPELLATTMGGVRRLMDQHEAAVAAAEAAAAAAAAAMGKGRPPLPPLPPAPLPGAAAATTPTPTTSSGRKVGLNPRFGPAGMGSPLTVGDDGAGAASLLSWGGDLGAGGAGIGPKKVKKRGRATTVLTEGVRQAFIKYMRGNSNLGEQSAHMFAGAANALVHRVLVEVGGERVAAETQLDLPGLQRVVLGHFDVFEGHTRDAYANLPRIWKLLQGFVAHHAGADAGAAGAGGARQPPGQGLGGLPGAAGDEDSGVGGGWGGGSGALSLGADGDSAEEWGEESESESYDGDGAGGGTGSVSVSSGGGGGAGGGARLFKRRKGEEAAQEGPPQALAESEPGRVVAHEEDDDDEYDLRGIIFGLPPKPKPRHHHHHSGSRRKRGGWSGAQGYAGYSGIRGGLGSLMHDGVVAGGLHSRKPAMPVVLAQETRMGFIGWMAMNTANRGASLTTILRAINNFLARHLSLLPGGEACLEALLPLGEMRALVERYEVELVQEVLRSTNSSIKTFWRHWCNFLRESQGDGLKVFVAAAESLESGDVASISTPAAVAAAAQSKPFILPLSHKYDTAAIAAATASRGPAINGAGGGGAGAMSGGNGLGPAFSSSANSVASAATATTEDSSSGAGVAGAGAGAGAGGGAAYFDRGGGFYQAGGRRRHKKGSGAYAAMLDTRKSIKVLRAQAEAAGEREMAAALAESRGYAGAGGGGERESVGGADDVEELHRHRAALAAAKRSSTQVLDAATRDAFMAWMGTHTKMQPVSMVTSLRTANRLVATMLVLHRGPGAVQREWTLDEVKAFMEEHRMSFIQEASRNTNVSARTFLRHFIRFAWGDEALHAFNRDLFDISVNARQGEARGNLDAYGGGGGAGGAAAEMAVEAGQVAAVGSVAPEESFPPPPPSDAAAACAGAGLAPMAAAVMMGSAGVGDAGAGGADGDMGMGGLQADTTAAL